MPIEITERITKLRSCLLAVVTAILAAGCFSGQPGLPKQFVTGSPIRKSIVNNVIQSYMIPLKKREYIALKIKQNDVDVIVEVFKPNGESIGKYDTPTSGRGTEIVRFGSDIEGEYKVNVYTLSENAEPGTYTLELAEKRPLTDRDRKILEAVNLHQQADLLRANADTRQSALPLYDKALAIWRETNSRSDEGNTLRAMGFTYQRMDELENAKEYFGGALKIWEEIGDDRSAAFSHVIFGVISKKQNDLVNGLKEDIEAQTYWIKAGDLPEATQNLVRIAGDHKKLGNKAESLAYFDKALESSKEIERKSVKAFVLSSYADALEEFGDRTTALKYYDQALTHWKSLGQEKAASNLREKMEKLVVR